MSAIKNLVNEIVDYAGLFPPASLPLEEVVENYESYLGCDDAWMLARLILPIGRMEEFERLEAFVDSKHKWKISALIPSVDAPEKAFDSALDSISLVNSKYKSSGKTIIDTVEVKTPTIKHIEETIEEMPDELNAFLEIPHHEDPAEHIAAVAKGGDNIFAKIRTGGVTDDLIPTPAEVARFIAECAKQDVGFKATAGLHHPLHGDYRLTYENDPDIGTMFGFVNVFVAVCLAFSNEASAEKLEAVLTESEPAAFEFSDDKLTWGELSTTVEQIKEIRAKKAVSFGSCSFTEPTSELRQLGWLD